MTSCGENNSQIIYNDQSNKARYVYTISKECPINTNSCLLYNGLFLYKRPRSDEKFTYNESIIHSIVRTIAFQLYFKCQPKNSFYEIIYTGNVVFDVDLFIVNCHQWSLAEFVCYLDSFFGKNFCNVAKRQVTRVYLEYKKSWRYFKYGCSIKMPSALDVITTYRFLNNINCSFSDTLRFVRSESNLDNKIYLQNRIKDFKY